MPSCLSRKRYCYRDLRRWGKRETINVYIIILNRLLLVVQELCESRGGRPGPLPVRPDGLSGFRGRKAILNHASALVSACP